MDNLDPALGTLAHIVHDAPDRQRLLDDFAGGLSEALGADLLQVVELDADGRGFVLVAGRGFAPHLYGSARVPAGLYSQAGRAALDPAGEPVILEDFSAPHDWYIDPLLDQYGARSGVTIKVPPEGRNFGALGAFYREPHRFQPEVLSFISTAASILGAAIDRLYRQAAAEAWRARTELLRSGAALTRVPASREELLSAATLAAVSGGAGGSQPIADWCFADVLESNGPLPCLKRVAVDHAWGAPEHLERAFSVPLAPTAPHGPPRVHATGQPELVARTGPRFRAAIARDPHHRRAVEEARPYSYVCAPVASRDYFHGTLGFLRVESGVPVAYDESDLASCAEFASLLALAIEAGLPHPDIQEAREAVSGSPHNGASPHGLTPVEAALEEPTERQQAVLDQLAAGKSVGAAASTLCIAYSTAKTHRSHLRQKLGLPSKSSDIKIVSEARRRGWLGA